MTDKKMKGEAKSVMRAVLFEVSMAIEEHLKKDGYEPSSDRINEWERYDHAFAELFKQSKEQIIKALVIKGLENLEERHKAHKNVCE